MAACQGAVHTLINKYQEFCQIFSLKQSITCSTHVPFFFFFFNCYLAAPRPTSGHYRGDSLTHPMLITAFLPIRPEGHREPRSEVGSLRTPLL